MKASNKRFYIFRDALKPGDKSYVTREADRELLQALLVGELCYVVTAEKTGKTSLIKHTHERLSRRGVAVGQVDLQGIETSLGPEGWYEAALEWVGRYLGLETELLAFWNGPDRVPGGPVARWIEAIRRVVLTRRPGRVVIFIDELGMAARLLFPPDDFLAAIRAHYLGRDHDPEMARLTFCLMGSRAPSSLIRHPDTPAFNVGRRVEVDDFSYTAREAKRLARGLKNDRRDARLAWRLLGRVFYWTGGHPYLTQRLCQAVAEDAAIRTAAGIDRACSDTFFTEDIREKDPLFAKIQSRLLTGSDGERRPEGELAGVLGLYQRTRSRLSTVRGDDRNANVDVLLTSGVARIGPDGVLDVRNRIYRRVFDRRWIRDNMPDAERRRERAYFLSGFLMALIIFCVVTVSFVWLGINLSAAKDAALDARAAAQRERDAAVHAREEALRQRAAALDARTEAVTNLNIANTGFFKLINIRAITFVLRFIRPVKELLVANVNEFLIGPYDELVSKQPKSRLFYMSDAACHHFLGHLFLALDEPSRALLHCSRAFQRQLSEIKLELKEQSEGRPEEDEAIVNRADLIRFYRDLKEARRRTGKPGGGDEEAELKELTWPGETAIKLYEKAGCLLKEAKRRGRNYNYQAIELLQLAVDRGFTDAERLKRDESFKGLKAQDPPLFQRLIEGASRNGAESAAVER